MLSYDFATDNISATLILDDNDGDLLTLPKRRGSGFKKLSRKGLTSIGNWYATIPNYTGDGKCAYVHRIIAERILGRPLYTWEVVDHRNNDTLDCRRSNLRITTTRINALNRVNRAARLRGAHYVKTTRRWRSAIRVNNKIVHLGTFSSSLAAHEAYIQALASICGNSAAEEMSANH
jgi:hypothetical protein